MGGNKNPISTRQSCCGPLLVAHFVEWKMAPFHSLMSWCSSGDPTILPIYYRGYTLESWPLFRVKRGHSFRDQDLFVPVILSPDVSVPRTFYPRNFYHPLIENHSSVVHYVLCGTSPFLCQWPPLTGLLLLLHLASNPLGLEKMDVKRYWNRCQSLPMKYFW